MPLSFSNQIARTLMYFMLLCFCACTQAQILPLANYEHIYISAMNHKGQDDEKWATYLFNQLDKRTNKSGVITNAMPNSNLVLQVVIGIDFRQPTDYQIQLEKHKVILSAKGSKELLWLIYQFISKAGEEDGRIVVTDLPPAILSIEKVAGNFAFAYRGLYTPSNRDEEMLPIRASNNIDFDWGLWGHNLHKVIGENVSDSLFALIDGKRNKEQYCFSSEVLYEQIEAYVIDNWGVSKASRVSVMPNDNELVCQCSDCRLAGNSEESATPAVSQLINRLAQRFPNHLFYTSAYLTTKQPSQVKMATNVGVIISAIDLPMQAKVATTTQGITFRKNVEAWKRSVSHIYVWDYIRNFDDYLSPYPMLGIVKERLELYKSIGIEGVIFNGSGEDYALFDDLQTYILQSMLIKPTIDVKKYVELYLEKYYPISSFLLEPYYLSLEERVVKNKIRLSYYEGIEAISKSYLYSDEFENFYTQLDKISKLAVGSERKQLNKMLTAMQFTRLEIMRMPTATYNSEQTEETLALLKGHDSFPDMKNFKESGGSLTSYIEQRSNQNLINREKGNLLQNNVLRCTDEYHSNLSVVTDGHYGLPIDYHLGWYISSKETLTISLPLSEDADWYKIRIGMLQAKEWNLYTPQSVEVWGNNRCISTFLIDPLLKEETAFRIMPEAIFQLTSSDLPLELRIRKNSLPAAKLAIDEIEIYKYNPIR